MMGARNQRARRGGRRAGTAVRVSPRELLLPYQEAWVEDGSRYKVGVWSRQTGKSFSTACEAVINCLADPGTKWVCLSAGERQSLEWLEKAKEWSRAFKLGIESAEEARDAAEALLKSAEIRFDNGSNILAIPANPSTARGYSANIILDEFAYHENPEAIWAAMYPSQTNPLAGTFLRRVEALNRGKAVEGIRRGLKLRVVSTFNGRNNKFHSLWERRLENGYSGHRVDIYTAVKAGLPLDPGQLRAGLDDPAIWAQEYECAAADASAVLLPYELLAACESAEATTVIGAEYFSSGRAYVMGIDFARKRDLSVAWTDELAGEVTESREVLELRGVSTPDQIELLRPRVRHARRVCLDYTGPGVGLGDWLAKEFGEYKPEQGRFGKVELCTFTNRLKAEIFTRLRIAFERRRTRIPVNREVREDLHSVQRVAGNSGLVSYRAPHNEEGHADRCAAKALAQRASECAGGPVQYARLERMPNRDHAGDLGMGRPKAGVFL